MPASRPNPGRAVFLDRDGVINVHRPDYLHRVEDFEYVDDAERAFELLGRIGLPVVIVSNQSGISRGYQTAEEVETIHARLRADAARWGCSITSVEICPHLPTEGCDCRKPKPGMFERAARRHGLRFDGSYMVGDAPADMEVGRRLGLHTIRVATGRGAEGDGSYDDERVANFFEAVEKIQTLESERDDA